MRFLLTSDLHPNFYTPDFFDPLIHASETGDAVWIDAGDGDYLSRHVQGNHDYWSGSVSDMPDCLQIEDMFKTCVVLGLTLWTNFDTPERMKTAKEHMRGMNDFRFIDGFTPEAWNLIHTYQWETLEKAVLYHKKYDPSVKIVVVTHHIPDISLVDPTYRNDPMNVFYASDSQRIRDLFKHVDVWCYGHTHKSSDKVIDGCRFLCNPWGYPGESRGKNFKDYMNSGTFEV